MKNKLNSGGKGHHSLKLLATNFQNVWSIKN